MVTADGRADFELLSGRMMTPAARADAAAVSLYVFDLLRMGDEELLDRPWTVRSSALEDLDLAAVTAGVVRVVSYTSDAATMWDATRAVGAEGLVIKRHGRKVRIGSASSLVEKGEAPVQCLVRNRRLASTDNDKAGPARPVRGRRADRDRHAGHARGSTRRASRGDPPLRAPPPDGHGHPARALPPGSGALHQPHADARPSARSLRQSGPRRQSSRT